MRPIDKGPAPAAYTKYADALPDLEQRLGRYCSYCEQRIPIGLAVEHKAPKCIHPQRKLDWDNFLLSCPICNSVKGEKDVAEDETLWPDQHNTFLAIAYQPGGLVGTNPALPADLRARAETLIGLVGLDRHMADGFPRPSRRDRRWLEREEAWSLAKWQLAAYEQLDRSETALQQIRHAARGHGFLSIWLTVFDGHPNVKRALIELFDGTCGACFGEDGGAVARTTLGV